MYSALLLLGYTSGVRETSSAPVEACLSVLSNLLGAHGIADELSIRSCLDLGYASLLAPPAKLAGAHPVLLTDLMKRLESKASSFSQEEQLLLGQMHRALELLPWNRNALRAAFLSQEWAKQVETDSGRPTLPLAFFASVLGVLAPNPLEWACGLRGVAAAAEVRDGLEEVLATLRRHDVKSSLVLDDLSVGAFVLSTFGPDAVPTRFVWGSSLHYAETPDGVQRLVPAARLQVAALQVDADAAVIVVPHFGWPKGTDRELKARFLINLFEQHALKV